MPPGGASPQRGGCAGGRTANRGLAAEVGSNWRILTAAEAASVRRSARATHVGSDAALIQKAANASLALTANGPLPRTVAAGDTVLKNARRSPAGVGSGRTCERRARKSTSAASDACHAVGSGSGVDVFGSDAHQ